MTRRVIIPRETNYLFYENGYYKIENEMLFQPPEFSRKMLYHIYNSNLAVLAKLKKGLTLTAGEQKDLENVSTFMICYLNGFDEAKEN
jgi:DNA polymerase III delta subunit